MIIYGKNPVREAVRAAKTIDKLFVAKEERDPALSQIISAARDGGATVVSTDRRALDKLAEGGNHQGIAAQVTDFVYSSLDDIFDEAAARGEKLLVVLLDGITDPNNLGGIIRSAECAGVDGIVIPSRRAAGVTETVIKVSAGATQHVLIHKAVNVNDVIRRLKDMNVYVYAADMKGKPMYSVNLKGDVAIVIGSEGEGVKRLTLELSDDVISIPQMGKINSLNASVAAGIVLFEKIRQENF